MQRPVTTLLLTLLLPSMSATAAAGQATPAPAPAAPAPPRMFAGGGIGLSFGDVDYVSITPFLGVHINPRVDAGVGVQYTYRNDNRFAQDLTTNDYGGSVFTRVYVAEGVFAGAAYEYLRFEYYDIFWAKVSDDYSSVFVGGGLSQPMGRSAFVVSAMYNLSWSDDEPSPYDSPWVITAGVSVGF